MNDESDASGSGEGKTFLGATTVMTDADSAYAWFSIVSGTPLEFGQFVSATATDEFGNTSEFAPNLPVGFNTRIYEADEYVVNTTQSGIPLHWPDGRAEFNLAPSVIASGFQAEIEQSFQIWNTEALRPDLSPLVEYTPAAPYLPTEQWGGYPDGVHNVVWVSSNWEGVTGAPDGAIAVTRVRYNAFTGTFTDVDMAYDAEHFVFGNSGSAPATAHTEVPGEPAARGGPAAAASRRGRARPRFPTDAGSRTSLTRAPTRSDTSADWATSTSPATSAGTSGWGATAKISRCTASSATARRTKQSLEPGDINGLAYIYDNVPKSSLDLVLIFDATATFESNYHAFGPSKNGATALVNKLRENDRIAVVKLPDSVVVPLTAVNPENIGSVIDKIDAMTIGGTAALGTGLETGLDVLNVPAPNRKTMILFGAGEGDRHAPGA